MNDIKEKKSHPSWNVYITYEKRKIFQVNKKTCYQDELVKCEMKVRTEDGR